MPSILHSLFQRFRDLLLTLEQAFLHLSQLAHYSIALSAVADLPRRKNPIHCRECLATATTHHAPPPLLN